MLEEIIKGEGEYAKAGGYRSKRLAPVIKCADGAELSVQASRTHYCTPRTDTGPYSEVEIGFPTVAPPDSWERYFDGDWVKDGPTNSVYAYVPIEMVREYVRLHGGEATDGNQS